MGQLVSVIIPTYNAASFIQRTINSVLGQTIVDLEIIVSDDGSTDETYRLVDGYGTRIKSVRIDHVGLPAVTRNAALQLATGEYIAFLDADDTWEPGKLEKQLAAMRSTNCLASATNAWRIRPGEKDTPYFVENVPQLLTFQHLLSVNFVICSSAILHRSILERTGNFPELPSMRAQEDYALWLRVAALTDWAYLSEPLTCYTDIPSQSIRREVISVFEQKRRVLDNFSEWAIAEHSLGPSCWQAQQARVKNSLMELRYNLRTASLFGTK